MYELVLIVLVVITALTFDFTNGFHDTGNAMATSIATGALKPRTAVAMSAVLNLAGAFLSLSVAAAMATGLVHAEMVTLPIVLAGLCGGIIWNLLTWLLGLPSSSSHALIGGIVGAVLVASGMRGVLWSGVAAKVLIPAVLAPLVAMLVSAVGTRLVYTITATVPDQTRTRGFRWAQIGSASLVSLAHGTNDAQKTMGVIFLALIAGGYAGASGTVPLWVIVTCALAIAVGTYTGGWRIIRTLGKGLVEIEAPQGMAAETSSAAVVLLSSHFGMPLSTTHVATGSILGAGVGKKGALVRWGIAGRMAVAWLLTLPAAAAVGGVCSLVAGSGGAAGPLIVFAALTAISAYIFYRSRRHRVHPGNVNDDWDQAPVAVRPPASAQEVAS